MTLLQRIITLAALIALGACTTIERAAIPAARITDPGWSAYAEGSSTVVDHGAWQGFLERYRTLGADGIARLTYAQVTEADRTALKGYIGALSATAVARLDRPEQLAFWINLYNAKTVDLVLDAYPVASIRDVGGEFLPTGPWGRPLLNVRGKPLSLNDIEHAIVRPIWRDARVHYAFNCAALGCPNLAADAYTGANVENLLEANARAYVNDPRGFRIDDGHVTASKIYAWFAEDFGGNAQGVLEHALPYARPDLAEDLKAAGGIDAYDYDWGLNETPPPTS